MAKTVEVIDYLHDSRPHVNVVFVGHVDAGKSTTCGNILVLSGLIDKRVVEKYEKEAKEKNREGWYLAYVFDLTEEERSKGKTVEVGRATFELEKTRFTILDAPGHSAFVPNMIAGAAQADVGVLIVSARKNEFEAGFDRNGQTREHALLCKTLGVQTLIVAVNKMDESTCQWSQARFDEIQTNLTPFLKNIGFPPNTVQFVPISGLSGQNIQDHVSDPSYAKFEPKASWYPKEQPTLLQMLDSISSRLATRDLMGSFRLPVVETYKEQGCMTIGKIERGNIKTGDSIVVVPGNKTFKVDAVLLPTPTDDEGISIPAAGVGENVCMRIEGADPQDIPKGSVLCGPNDPIRTTRRIKAQAMIVDVLECRPVITAGYMCVFHAHTLQVDCTVVKLIDVVDKATKRKVLKPAFVKNGQIITAILEFEEHICLEKFDQSAALGRFTLRDENKTIGIGKVLQTHHE